MTNSKANSVETATTKMTVDTPTENTTEPPRAWQRMLSGRRLDLLNPSQDDIAIEDIAQGLARVARWNGQTVGDHAFSVAQHVLIVEKIASDLNPDWSNQWRLAALLHDGAEYVVGDLISPFKNAVGLNYRSLENRLMEAIHLRFGLPALLPSDVQAQIKHADRIAAYFEATRLAGFSLEEARRFFGEPPKLRQELDKTLYALQPVSTGCAQNNFLMRFNDLSHFD